MIRIIGFWTSQNDMWDTIEQLLMNLDKFTSNGKFLMLALDHRGSIKKLINPKNPDSVSDEQVISIKREIINALADQFSGLLIDEHWGLEACKEVCQYKPYLLPLEKSGHVEDGEERITELEYEVVDLMKLGASGAKILFYFNPNVASAKKQLETAKKLVDECRHKNYPLFLEIVTYTPVILSEAKNIYPSAEPQDDKMVLESVKMFIENDAVPDVWKLEYPGSAKNCELVTKLVGDSPWILLTGGETYEEFKPKLEEAIKGGARGFLAGRAIWQEVCTLEGEEKKKFLKETLPNRFREISEVASKS